MEERLYDMIFKRKSFHLFRNCGQEEIIEEDVELIRKQYQELVPLYPEIKTAIRIVRTEETTCKRGQEYCILFYSEKKDGYLANIGYLGEQLDLWLVSRDIGTLWFGIGKVEEASFEGLDFVIMMAIRKIPDASIFRKDMFKSKRKPVEEIWQGEEIEGVTDIVRFAPSACNTQPWLVINDGDTLSVYRYRMPGKRGIMPADQVAFYNRIDIGIFLCFLELCLQNRSIGFQRELFIDRGGSEEMTLNAVYRITEKQ
ncbi:MAG: nitroreductase [Erysipelotrichaceae bacterium]|nr:nitroreductase [Erysipelotrichaceae bacterium]